MRTLFRFPDPVNEIAARVVAGGVVLQCVAILTGATWLLAVLAYGFVARVATGPTLSPLGQLATKVVAPRLGAPRLVPGVPKRFAQGLGAALSVSAATLHFALGQTTAALVIVGAILAAATLEAAFGRCIGCMLFARLVALGIIPEHHCAACADLARAPHAAA